MRFIRAQGATEYLVLLAVVLIIATVSIALLGFFPGTASDAQLTESQIYWKSASPIAIVEVGGGYVISPAPNASVAYLGLRNTGGYPIQITRVLGAGSYLTGSYNQGVGWQNISDASAAKIAPGETGCFGTMLGINTNQSKWQPCYRNEIAFRPSEDADNIWPNLAALSTGCDANGKGLITIKDFGFQYTETIEGQTIVKKFIGTKPLIIKCVGICNAFGDGTCYAT